MPKGQDVLFPERGTGHYGGSKNPWQLVCLLASGLTLGSLGKESSTVGSVSLYLLATITVFLCHI